MSIVKVDLGYSKCFLVEDEPIYLMPWSWRGNEWASGMFVEKYCIGWKAGELNVEDWLEVPAFMRRATK